MHSQPSKTVESSARDAIVAAMMAAHDNAIERVGRQVLGRAGADWALHGHSPNLSWHIVCHRSGDVNVGYGALLTLIAVVAVARLAWLLSQDG